MSGFNFDEQSVKRIVRSVLHSERSLRGGGDQQKFPENVNQVWHPFKNEYAGEVPAFGVIEITGFDLINTLPGVYYYKGDRPSTTFRKLYAVNSAVPVKQGGYGQCRFTGEATVAYDSGTPAFGEGWGPKPGQFTLSKGFPGLVTVGGIQSADNKWLLGSLHEINTLLCKTTGAIAGGTASTSYQIWVGTLGSESNGGWTTVPSALSREDIDSGLFVKLTWHNNGWIMEPLECNA